MCHGVVWQQLLPARQTCLGAGPPRTVVLMQLLTQEIQSQILVTAELMTKAVLIDVRHLVQ